MQNEELHISSLVVHAAPARLGEVEEALGGIDGARVHASSPAGKLVLTLEQPSAAAMTDAVLAIQRLSGVLSASLVYQCADTLQAMNEEIPHAQA
jgi:nitrate reductase NapD